MRDSDRMLIPWVIVSGDRPDEFAKRQHVLNRAGALSYYPELLKLTRPDLFVRAGGPK